MTDDTDDTDKTDATGDGAPGTPKYGPVWTFRGYEMRPSEFNTAMVHYYRAEIQRSNVWRTRLDTTTNWAVVATGAAITFAFSSPENTYLVIVLDTLLVLLFLAIEARRYRYYELWSLRARLMETDFFAAMLVPPFSPHAGWDEALAETLLQPEFPITRLEAIGRRLRNNYLWIILILGVALVLKLYIHPTPARTLGVMVDRAALGPIGGEMVLFAWLIFLLAIVIVSLATTGLTDATGEIVPKYNIPHVFGDLLTTFDRNGRESGSTTSWSQRFGKGRRRQQLLAFIVASNPQGVADRIIKEMNRGVTALHGRGMYLQQERDVLTVALTVTEVEHLKTIVREEDPHAFLTVMPAKEIVGEGFVSLEEDE
jgi:uncharacterized membrane protein